MAKRILALTFALIVVAVSVPRAQTAANRPGTRGDRPNLSGVWDFRTQIPLERDEEIGERAFLTPEEIAELREKISRPRSATRDSLAPVADDARSSLIVDPPNGRLPPLQPGVEPQVGSLGEDLPTTRPLRYRGVGTSADHPEDRGLAERCLLGFNSGPPIVPGGYNQNIQIVQAGDYVALVNEMAHDARIIPLDGRAHAPDSIRQWMGDSRGRWDGDTLVVETTNFTDQTSSFTPNVWTAIGTGATLHLTERFRLVQEDVLEYEYTVDDPVAFTRPFTVLVQMRRGTVMYEYACHEGNYSMETILRAGRVWDAAQSTAAPR